MQSATGRIAQSILNPVKLVDLQARNQRDILAEFLIYDLAMMEGYQAPDTLETWIWDLDADCVGRNLAGARKNRKHRTHGIPIGARKPASSQVGSTVIAAHNDRNISKAGTLQDGQDRPTRRP